MSALRLDGSRSQTLRGAYGLRSLTVDARVPTAALRQRLGRTDVGVDPAEVEAEVRALVARARVAAPADWTDALAEQTVKAALWLHRRNGREYAWLMRGGHGG